MPYHVYSSYNFHFCQKLRLYSLLQIHQYPFTFILQRVIYAQSSAVLSGDPPLYKNIRFVLFRQFYEFLNLFSDIYSIFLSFHL